MEEKKNLSEISNESLEITKKNKTKSNEESLVDDLKESFNSTFEQSTKILKQILVNLESNIRDEELKIETEELIKNINHQLKNIIKETQETFGSILSSENYEEE